MKRIIFTVTNDLDHDQRMIRTCTSLTAAGYNIMLVGAKKRGNSPLTGQSYRQKRIRVFFSKGFFFYAEYNTRLFFYLLFSRFDAACCIDLDTILPVWLATRIRGKKRIYDAHEYFSQQKEIISRPRVYKIWHWIEKKFVPRFLHGYTVSASIAAAFREAYGVNYALIRNLPLLEDPFRGSAPEKIVIYQGAVNEARGLEFLIPAMKAIAARLFIYGDGNYMAAVKALIISNNLNDKVFLKGKLLPAMLNEATRSAYIGINLVENTGLNQYYSLANKFFDYLHHGLPQVTMNFPEYAAINKEFEVAILVNDLEEMTLVTAINSLLNDEVLYSRLRENCLAARQVLNWQAEEKILLAFYKANIPLD